MVAHVQHVASWEGSGSAGVGWGSRLGTIKDSGGIAANRSIGIRSRICRSNLDLILHWLFYPFYMPLVWVSVFVCAPFIFLTFFFVKHHICIEKCNTEVHQSSCCCYYYTCKAIGCVFASVCLLASVWIRIYCHITEQFQEVRGPRGPTCSVHIRHYSSASQ